MKRNLKWSFQFFILLSLSIINSPLQAYPIATFISVPVAKGGYAFQSEILYQNFRNDTAGLKLDTVAFPQLFAYGITNRVTIFTVIPLVYADFNVPGFLVGNEFGVADIPIALKEDIYRKQSHLQNIQFSLTQGIEIPSGDDPFTSNSIDFPFLGGVFTWQTPGNEIDQDFSYKINTDGGGGFNEGDEFFHDTAYSRRLLPWKLPEEGQPFQWNVVLELNGHYAKRDTGGGDFLFANSGGYTLLLTSGFNFIFPKKNFNLDVAAQVPMIQDLNGTQLENQYNVLVRFTHGGAFF